MGCSWSVPDAKYGGGFVLKNCCWARQRGKLSILDDNRLHVLGGAAKDQLPQPPRLSCDRARSVAKAESHAEMLGTWVGLHAGQERRSDRIALRLRDLATTPLRSTSRPPRSGYRSAPGERPSHQRVLRLTPQA